MLQEILGEDTSRERLNDLVDRGDVDFSRIKDMRSLTAFTKRLNGVLDNILGAHEVF
jgi:hypothetical protein